MGKCVLYCIHLVEDKDKWQALLNTAINIWVHKTHRILAAEETLASQQGLYCL